MLIIYSLGAYLIMRCTIGRCKQHTYSTVQCSPLLNCLFSIVHHMRDIGQLCLTFSGNNTGDSIIKHASKMNYNNALHNKQNSTVLIWLTQYYKLYWRRCKDNFYDLLLIPIPAFCSHSYSYFPRILLPLQVMILL